MAASCPACGRPVALARPRCLYCGASLPKGVVEEAAASAAATEAAQSPAAGPPRALLVVDYEGADAAALAAALGAETFEAAQRVRRGGWQLQRIVPAEEAAGEADRLGRAGVRVLVLPEPEVRAGTRAVVASGGAWEGSELTLRTEGGPVRLGASGVMLVVRGPIAREYATQADVRRVRTATLEPGYRFHVHRKDDPRPLELDPAAFGFGLPSPSESSLLLLSAWVDTLGAGAPVDDRFRRETPALGPAAAEAMGIGAALGGAGKRRKDEVPVLDNLEQFRFYSAWRAAVSRRAR